MASTEQKTDTIEDVEEDIGGLDDDDDETLILISSEDDNPREFEISRKAALMCNLVKSILEGGKLNDSHFIFPFLLCYLHFLYFSGVVFLRSLMNYPMRICGAITTTRNNGWFQWTAATMCTNTMGSDGMSKIRTTISMFHRIFNWL